jgi:MoxR-like ATPase
MATEYSNNVFGEFLSEFNQHIFDSGQLSRLLLAAFLSKVHVLLEGPPGVAKTSAVKVISALLGKEVKRVQFTPDLMPSDITGYALPTSGNLGIAAVPEFHFMPGPVFTDIFIADEINRAPARTQSALLEAMEERAITVEGKHRQLSPDFWVLATQNPREMEGTYPLPEAQLDRFGLILHVEYLNESAEINLARMALAGKFPVNIGGIKPFFRLGELINTYHKCRERLVYSDALLTYATHIVRATRTHQMFRFGASPRALFHLLGLAGAMTILEGRDIVEFDDIKNVAVPVLAHRVKLSDSFDLGNNESHQMILSLLHSVPIPR